MAFAKAKRNAIVDRLDVLLLILVVTAKRVNYWELANVHD
jgi:hypothetical protein